MSNVYRGSTSVEQPIRETFSTTGGYRTTRTYKGTQAQMESLYTYWTGLGATCEIEGGPVWTLTVDVQGDDPEYSWEILSEAQSVDVTMTDLFFGLTANEHQALRDFFDNFEGGEIKNWPDGIDSTLARQAFLLKLRGLNEVTLFVPVLRSSYVVQRDYEIPTATTNINRVHSKATLISVESVPSRLWGAMPDSSTAVYSDVIGSDPFNLTYYYGWLKGPPQVTHTGWDKVQIVQEYRYASYAAEVYGAML